MQINAHRRRGSIYSRVGSALLAFVISVTTFGGAVAASSPQLAFPGALGWAAQTAGGRGGKIIRVTTLAADGPGSFVEHVPSSELMARILTRKFINDIVIGFADGSEPEPDH